MKEQKKNEELQSRREFFRNAAKAALPILGVIALAHAPILSQAAEHPATCIGNCWGTCKGTCTKSCNGNCAGLCTTRCFSTSRN